jgi:cell fate regulator YaaT (PSP1 superfamily)
MAKEQGLSLNPTKISGQCGRLMCCLTYENDTYMALKKNFPKVGKIIKNNDHEGKVIRHNVLAGSIVLRTNDGQEIEIAVDTISPK